MKTYHILIKDNATGREKLWNLQQRTISDSKSTYKMETVSARCNREIWSLDKSWKPEVFQRTSQTQWKISQMVFETTGFWLQTLKEIIQELKKEDGQF